MYHVTCVSLSFIHDESVYEVCCQEISHAIKYANNVAYFQIRNQCCIISNMQTMLHIFKYATNVAYFQIRNQCCIFSNTQTMLHIFKYANNVAYFQIRKQCYIFLNKISVYLSWTLSPFIFLLRLPNIIKILV